MGKATVNPFVSDSWSMSNYERVRLAVLGVTLAPLRLVGMVGMITFDIAGSCMMFSV
jgi:hypothetical protein